MRSSTCIALVMLCSACFGSAREDAVLATNTAQAVLTSVDDVWAPIVKDKIDSARVLDDAGYKKTMAPYLVVQEAIEQARRATQLMNLAVQTWDAQHDEGAMFREMIPCVIEDIQLIRALLAGHEAQAPPQIPRALDIVEGAFIALSKGGVCERDKPGKLLADPFPVADAGASP